ncbi:hypothetical protein WQQ_40700 [Hydrocarboniphaga effusa AP103]|uniref:Uncharacterized protein n=1 Tax=Hydrocarboniphaga effusa AP103 TaxID=1172194 RepID=I8T173_9GAMM|nr:hypothetical protein WQQ_40700 [Hydrocarboniphaga effusa AP103]
MTTTTMISMSVKPREKAAAVADGRNAAGVLEGVRMIGKAL